MKKLGKNSWIIIVTVLTVFACISLFLAMTTENTGSIERGKVVSVIRNIKTPTEEDPYPGQLVRVKITTGAHRGQVVESYNIFKGSPQYDIPVGPGQPVILSLEQGSEGQLRSTTVSDVTRDLPLLLLFIAFVAMLVFFGKKKGTRFLLTFVFAILVFFEVLLPLISNGNEPVTTTIIIAAIIAGVTLLSTFGWKRKTLAAFLGVAAGLICSGLLSVAFGRFALLTGLGSIESHILDFVQNYDLDFKGILFASIVFGSLGAMIEMSLTIAEKIDEMFIANPITTPKELYTAGLDAGRHVIGSITHVMMFSYLGCVLPMMLIVAGFQPSFFKVINLDIVATEVIRGLMGCLGLFLVVPLTAAFSAWLVYEEVMLKYYP